MGVGQTSRDTISSYTEATTKELKFLHFPAPPVEDPLGALTSGPVPPIHIIVPQSSKEKEITLLSNQATFEQNLEKKIQKLLSRLVVEDLYRLRRMYSIPSHVGLVPFPPCGSNASPPTPL